MKGHFWEHIWMATQHHPNLKYAKNEMLLIYTIDEGPLGYDWYLNQEELYFGPQKIMAVIWLEV